MATLTSAAQHGGLTGIVIDSRGRPLAGVCVTASAAATRERPDAASRSVVTSSTGMFMITGLPVGSYVLRYRRCLTPTGKTFGPRPAMLEPSAPTASITSSRSYVTGAHLTTLGRVAVRPLVVGQAAGMPTRPHVRRLTVTQLRRHFLSQGVGGIAGTVRGPHGRHIKGLCLDIESGGGLIMPIGADGRYSTGKVLPPGKYTVEFSAVCSFPFDTSSANWAPEWYRGKFRLSAANTVLVKAGKITRGIGGIMRRGGVISGRVTGRTGRGLGKVCVVAVTSKGAFVQQITTPRDGRYRFQGLDPGRYSIGFFPNCDRGSVYLPQWWPGKATETKAGVIKTGFGTARTHIDAKMVLGGTISGVVRFRNRHGRPIKGICVDATPARPSFFDYLAASNARGNYAIRGLPAGRYSLSFFPGCNNNGNYLGQNYPHNVTVHLAHVTGHINAYLQPGAIVTGTVTAKSTGAKLPGICVVTGDGFSEAETGVNGTYSMNQIPPGTIQVEFFNCSNSGNYAPQAAPAWIKVRPGQVVSGINAALAPGATISGEITLGSARKLSNVCIDAIPDSFSAALTEGGAESVRGRYVIKDLAPGLYQVLYSSCGGPNIADTWFMRPGEVTDDESRADQIYVPAGGLVPGINAVLQLGGFISGWAYGPSSQQGSDVCIFIGNAETGVVGFINGFFDVSVGGGYTIFGFAPGRYVVEFFPCSGQNLAVQWYKRASQPARATPVLVRPGRTTNNVDAWLTTGGSLTGRVVSRGTGKPLADVCVTAVGNDQPFGHFGRTNRSGKYVVTGLSSSSYRLYLFACGRSRLVPMVTRAIRATQDRTVTAPAVAMHPYRAGAISGRVAIAGSPPNAATGVCVIAISVDRGVVGSLETEFGTARQGGYYRIGGLVPGRYKVLIGAPCGTGPGDLVARWYRNASRESKATVVSVAAGRTTHRISVALQRLPRDGSISGTVTGPKPADKPLAGICVQVVPVARGLTPYLAESTAPTGRYRIGPLPPGRYLVEFEARCAAAGYATQWWRGASSMSHATLVIVRPGRSRSGINASMTSTG